MDTSLAIYEALIQANVPPPAARRVAETLEKDMSSNLATKQDIQHLDQLMATRFEAMDRRFDDLDSRISLKSENLESRVVIKLGTLMTILFGLAGTALALLR
jgi:tetrahydromethanopterin S-methyltransferase subunit G